MNESWRYVITPRAARDLRELDVAVRQRIFAALDGLVANAGRGDVRKLRAESDEHRLRVGDWRVRYRVPIVIERAKPPATGEVRVHEITVLQVLPRGCAYRD